MAFPGGWYHSDLAKMESLTQAIAMARPKGWGTGPTEEERSPLQYWLAGFPVTETNGCEGPCS